MILVVAAGNEGPNNNGFGSPAAADEVITVANVDNMETISRGDEVIADSSSRGPRTDDGDEDHIDELKPEISAPGENIMSVRHDDFGQGNPNMQGQYVESSGTSMACPHVAGIVACMLQAEPSLTPHEVKELLKKTAEKRGEVYDPVLDDDYSREYGWGIVDAYRAVMAALGELVYDDDIDIDFTHPDYQSTVNETVTFRGTVTVEGNVTIESVQINIQDVWYDVDGEESWSYEWNSWEVVNGNYTIEAMATGTNNMTSTDILKITVNNQGEEPKKESEDQLFDIEKLQELNEVTISLIGVIAVVVIVVIFLTVRRRRKRSDEEDSDHDGEEEESWI